MVWGLKKHHHDLRWAFGAGILMMLGGAWMQSEATRRQEARQFLLDRG